MLLTTPRFPLARRAWRAAPPLVIAAAALLSACTPRLRRSPTPAPAPVPAPVAVAPPRVIARAALPPANPKLPAVPAVTGPLRISVVYPSENALIAARDSNFILGSVGNGSAALEINGTPVPVWPNGAFLGWLPVPPDSAQRYELVAATARDTVSRIYRVRTLASVPPATTVRDTVVAVTPARYALLRDDSLAAAVPDTDQVIIGRPSPGGTYRWFLLPGTVVRVTGYQGEYARVQLDDEQTVWVDRDQVGVLPLASHPPAQRIESAALRPAAGWVDIALRTATPPAYLVEETERGITLTVYGAEQRRGGVALRSRDRYVTAVRQVTADGRTTFDVKLSSAPYGYLALWRDGMMTFRVRRPPVIAASAPLRGRTIAIDPGHPPIGATGPTGLYEPVATLAVGLRVRDLLAARGATVVMTRTTPEPVALGDRPIMARRANADALVSIHLNALPDGTNPFTNNGSGTYYFQPQSRLFAKVMEQSLTEQMGLRDLGTFRANLALARPTWMPSVLCEGAFIILPDQEAALRTPAYAEAYARGIVSGLERFFATFAPSM